MEICFYSVTELWGGESTKGTRSVFTFSVGRRSGIKYLQNWKIVVVRGGGVRGAPLKDCSLGSGHVSDNAYLLVHHTASLCL